MLVKFLDGTAREVALEPGVNLRSANLYGANLEGANLRSADLEGANLSADLRGADLEGAKGLAQFAVAPQVGAFAAFKKYGNGIVTLLVPAEAKRVNAYGSRKCRAEYAYVLSNTATQGEAYGGFKYGNRGLAMPDKYDPDPRVECSHGIHFFMTLEEAQEYRP